MDRPEFCRVARGPTLRVLHIVQSFDISGRSRIIHSLSRALRDDGIDSSIACLTREQQYVQDDVPVFSLSRKEGVDVGCLCRLMHLTKSVQATVLHSHGRGALPYAAWVRASGLVRGLVHSVHRADGDGRRLRWPREKVFSHLAHVATAVSAAAQRSFTMAHGWPAAKVRVVHPGLDVQRFRLAGDVGVADPELLKVRSEAAPLLGTVSNMSGDKDYATLLRGFRSLLKVLPTARLVMIGGGPQFVQTAAQIKRMGLSDTTRLLGFRRDVPAILRLFDIFILSSRTEGFGLSLLEAMASRVPVVASAIEGILEVVEDGNCGLTFAPCDAEEMARCVLRLWDVPALRERLADAAYERVLTRFSLGNVARTFSGLYVSSLTGRYHSRAECACMT